MVPKNLINFYFEILLVSIAMKSGCRDSIDKVWNKRSENIKVFYGNLSYHVCDLSLALLQNGKIRVILKLRSTSLWQLSNSRNSEENYLTCFVTNCGWILKETNLLYLKMTGKSSVLSFVGPVKNRGDSKRTEIISQIFESN